MIYNANPVTQFLLNVVVGCGACLPLSGMRNLHVVERRGELVFTYCIPNVI